MSEQLQLDLIHVSQFPFDRGHVKDVLNDVFDEVARQDEKWGEQNHPYFSNDGRMSVTLTPYPEVEKSFKEFNDRAVSNGTIGWDSILLEELFEALAQAGVNDQEYEYELVHTAAVCVAMVLANRRKRNG